MVKELKRLGVPVTVACKRLGISHSTYYYRSKDKSEDLKEAIMEIAYKHPSFGFRRITAVLRQQGFKVNPKKVYRLYRKLNLQKSVNRKGYRKRAFYRQPPVAEYPNHVWSLDIIEDRTEKGLESGYLTSMTFTPVMSSFLW